MSTRLEVGGQAVIEGVMMRSPKSFTVVCRRAGGQIVVREDIWQPIWAKKKLLRWPFLRGTFVLLESIWNGMAALSFSADQQAKDQQASAPKGPPLDLSSAPKGPPLDLSSAPKGPPQRTIDESLEPSPGMSTAAKTTMLITSIAFGLALFVGAPHLLAWVLGNFLGFDATTFVFHLADGVIKVAILLGYLSAISLVPEIRRVFQYHGAEHKAIHTYEQKLALTLENARGQTRFHPRCGTSFLLIVIMVSVVLFAALLRGRLADSVLSDHLLKIALKIPLMFPIAGIAYEAIKLSGRYAGDNPLVRILVAPGLWLQRITTREPTDDQIEIALISIRKTLWRERSTEAAPGSVEMFETAATIDLPLL